MRVAILIVFLWAQFAQAAIPSKLGFAHGFALGVEPVLRALSVHLSDQASSQASEDGQNQQLQIELSEGMLKSLSLALPFLADSSSEQHLVKNQFLKFGDLFTSIDQLDAWRMAPSQYREAKAQLRNLLPYESFAYGFLMGLEVPTQLAGRQLPWSTSDMLSGLISAIAKNSLQIKDRDFRQALTVAHRGWSQARDLIDRQDFARAEMRVRQELSALEGPMAQILGSLYREYERRAQVKLGLQRGGRAIAQAPLFRCTWMFPL